MALLFLEALGALALLLFIVWWTMFSGRKNGELPERAAGRRRRCGAQGGETAVRANG